MGPLVRDLVHDGPSLQSALDDNCCPTGQQEIPCIDLLRLVVFGCVPERVGDGGGETGRHPYGWRGGSPDDRGLLAGAFFAG